MEHVKNKKPKDRTVVIICLIALIALNIYRLFEADDPPDGALPPSTAAPKSDAGADAVPLPDPAPPVDDREAWIYGIEAFALDYLSSIEGSIEYSARVESVKIAVPLVVSESLMDDIRPDLTAAILLRESGFRFDARGSRDEHGIGQIMGGRPDESPEVQIGQVVKHINEAFDACPPDLKRDRYSAPNLIPVLAHYSSGKCDHGRAAAKRKYRTFLKAVGFVEEARISDALKVKNNRRAR